MPPFFTAYHGLRLDGGRDGLGLLPVWTSVARWGIWNVTSVSGDLAGWRTLLACAGLADMVAPAAEAQDAWREVALKAERLVGLARSLPGPVDGLRGKDRLRQAAARANAGERIDLDKLEILVGQARAGVFGQVARPAVRSGLLDGSFRLAPDAAATWGGLCGGRLEPHRDAIEALLVGGASFSATDHESLAAVLADVAGPMSRSDLDAADAGFEAQWLDAHVLRAGIDPNAHPLRPSHAEHPLGERGPAGERVAKRQHALADALRDRVGGGALLDEGASVVALARAIESGVGEGRADTRRDTTRWLRQIVAIEAVIGPMDAIFSRLLDVSKPDRERMTRARFCKTIEADFGTYADWRDQHPIDAETWEALTPTDGASRHDTSAIRAFDSALRRRDVGAALEAVVERNVVVSSQRGAASWVNLDGERMTARLSTGARSTLPQAGAFVHSFYLQTMQHLTNAVHPAAGVA